MPVVTQRIVRTRGKPKPKNRRCSHTALRETAGFTPVVTAEIPRGANVFLRRTIPGLGDFTQLIGAAQALKTQRPDIRRVTLVGPNKIWEIGKGAPGINVGPLRNRLSNEFPLQPGPGCPAGATETDLGPVPACNRLEIFSRFLGVAPQIPQLTITPGERDRAQTWCKRITGVTDPVVLVYRTSERWKDYHNPEELFTLLASNYPTVILEHDRLPKLPKPNTSGKGIRDIAAIVNQSRLVVTPDTGWLHVAGALRRPIFGLFGSQEPRFRQALYNVPGAWHQGACPHGKQPCWYKICCDRGEVPPCLRTSPETLAHLITDTLTTIYG